MRVEAGKTPENRWGERKDPYHLTGEITQVELVNNLTAADLSVLQIIMQHLYSLGEKYSVNVQGLLVGSSANKGCTYRDIDLLICPDNPDKRTVFPNMAMSLLEEDNRFKVLTKSRLGSAPTNNSLLYAPMKLFVVPSNNFSTILEHVGFDLTFSGRDGGTYSEVLSFHRLNNLAFCELRREIVLM